MSACTGARRGDRQGPGSAAGDRRAGRGGLARPEAGQRPLPRLGGGHLRREVVDQLRPALHRLRPRPVQPRRRDDRLAVRAGAGTGLRHRLLPAEPEAGRRARRGPSPTCARAWSRSPSATRRALGFEVQGRVADAESIPYPDDAFDLVVGHAVLHHIPDVELALREVLRVLKPGGRFVFAGEPTRYGDLIARRLSRLTWWATTRADPAARGCGTGRRPQGRTGRVVASGGAGGGGRPAHLRPGRAAGAGRAGRCGRRAGPAPTS